MYIPWSVLVLEFKTSFAWSLEVLQAHLELLLFLGILEFSWNCHIPLIPSSQLLLVAGVLCQVLELSTVVDHINQIL